MRLVDTGNINNPSLIVLEEIGCEISISPSDEENDLGFWVAKIDGHEFVAGDPLALLGLVTLWKYRGVNWRRPGDEDIYGRVIDETFGDG
jgi:hypothetical protein